MVIAFSSRGLAYWTDGQTERFIWATGDARVHAVDAATGEPVQEFGDDGSVDLMRGIRCARLEPPPINYSVTSPTVVCNDVIIVGSAVSDQPRFKESPTGYVRGFDARTGELRWTFHTIPLPGEVGHDTWRDGSASYTGNANVWTMMTADPTWAMPFCRSATPRTNTTAGIGGGPTSSPTAWSVWSGRPGSQA